MKVVLWCRNCMDMVAEDCGDSTLYALMAHEMSYLVDPEGIDTSVRYSDELEDGSREIICNTCGGNNFRAIAELTALEECGIKYAQLSQMVEKQQELKDDKKVPPKRRSNPKGSKVSKPQPKG